MYINTTKECWCWFAVVSRGASNAHGRVNIHEPRVHILLPFRDRFEADCLRMCGKIRLQIYF